MFRTLSLLRPSFRSFHTASLLRTPAPGTSTPSEKVIRLAEEIPTLNLLEINDLLKLLQVKLGLPDLSMVSQSAPTSSGPVKTVAAEAAKPAAVKTEFSVKLMKFDAASKIKVIKEVRELTKLDLKAAKELVEGAPKIVMKDLKKADAEEMVAKLKAAGATCELEV